MLRIIQRFGKHYSCHLQGEYVRVGRFIGQTVGDELHFDGADWWTGRTPAPVPQIQLRSYLNFDNFKIIYWISFKF
jgi:hypothetical protein